MAWEAFADKAFKGMNEVIPGALKVIPAGVRIDMNYNLF